MTRDPKYLVTGGAGFIGSNLVHALARAGERVRVVDNLATGFWENLGRWHDSAEVSCVNADIRDGAAMAQACGGIEVVFHLAALGSVPRSVEDPVLSDSVNVGGTVTLLDAARRAGVRRVVFSASSAAYGDTAVLPKREDMPTQPLSPYAVTKVADEHYLAVFAALYGIETVNLRYFNVFGPHQRPDGAYAAAIPKFVWAALARRARHHLRRWRDDSRFLLRRQCRFRQPLGGRGSADAAGRGGQHRRRPPRLAQRSGR